MFNFVMTWRQMKGDTSGVTALEYGLIAAVMGALIVIAFNVLGGDMDTAFTTIGSVLMNQCVVHVTRGRSARHYDRGSERRGSGLASGGLVSLANDVARCLRLSNFTRPTVRARSGGLHCPARAIDRH